MPITEPLPVKPLITQTTINKGNSLDRLKQKIASTQTNQDQRNQAQVVETELQTENKNITTQDFERVFNTYLEQLSLENKMSFASLLKTSEWRIENENTITLKMPSQHAIESFEDERINLIPYFRKALNNRLTDFTTSVSAVAGPRRPYNNKEKFEAIAERNPAVKEFKNLFMLDLE